jgi:hypothetical protein
MFARVMEIYWVESERFESWGKALISGSCAWLITGAVMTAAVFIVRTATRSEAFSIKTLFPQLPAWLPPESVEGTLPAPTSLLVGSKLTRIGALYKAQY